ncbi:hypothetical protein [Aerolutibacter ruishenii]|uniref:Helix-turn-helix protein n=1 Tax=Aerolutibacter ruishenii TaxID=686800 RepID=A0A562LYS9_9GAMM|nr:hypothetical protein [Lysobacter ruishenii]TWI12712.1 hypothetical protein IP93_01057 [Lysobacter ruishenii]
MADEPRKRPFVLQWRSAVLNSAEPASTKLTLLMLAEYADTRGANALPGMKSLAQLSSQSERTCRRALEDADGKWFTRQPVNVGGQQWRGYVYTLRIPEGADTTTARSRKGAVTVSAAEPERCGHSEPKVRTLTTEGAVTVSDELGSKLGKATRGTRSRAAPKVTFDSWIENHPTPDDVIPADHAVNRFAEKAGIPDAFMDLAWIAFQDRYAGNPKRYADWPRVFHNAVQGDWLKLWRYDQQSSSWVLTTAGYQLQLSEGQQQNRPNRLPVLEA